MQKNASSKINNLFAPIVFALLPVAYIVFKDYSLLSISDAAFYLALMPALSLVMFGFFYAFSRNSASAGFLTVVTIWAFLSFGVISKILKSSGFLIFEDNSQLASILLISFLWFILFLYGLKKTKSAAALLGWFDFTAKLIVFIFLGFVGFEFADEPEDTPKIGPQIPAVLGREANSSNIYYIMLEGFGRLDVLRDGFGVYTQDFEARLKELGFFIAGNSRANYLDTLSSLASSLNMDYINKIVEQESKSSTAKKPLRLVVQNSTVLSALKSRGYKIISLSTGRSDADLVSADIREGGSLLSEDILEFVLLNSPIDFFIETFKWYRWEYDNHRSLINGAFDAIPRHLSEKGPKFVFAHIMAPEPPFVFNAKGKPLNNKRRMKIVDGSEYGGSKLDYQKKYAAQVTYIMNRLLPMLDMLAHEDPFATIVIQGDHGSGLQFHWNSATLGDPNERAAIFNAYRLGGVSNKEAGLDHDISPVNSFRVIFNATFGFNLPILPNRTYFSPALRPYKYKLVEEATPRILTCRPSPSGRVGRIDPECLEPNPKVLEN
jgi:hypothetical protein